MQTEVEQFGQGDALDEEPTWGSDPIQVGKIYAATAEAPEVLLSLTL